MPKHTEKHNVSFERIKDTKAFKWIKTGPGKNKLKWSFIVLGGVLVAFIGFYISIYLGAFGVIPSKKELSSIKQEAATELYDRNGQLFGKYFIYDRQPLEYQDIPKHLIDALIATEDIRFYEHDGIDNISLFRVFFKSILLQDKSSGGGSTITLQLAKNLFGRKDYAFASLVINKLRESVIARRIEEIYNKKEILTLYLNTVPFPDNTYGIESAAQKFFNKSAIDLSLAESAVLIGTLKANTYYNPRLHPKRCQERRNVVLHQMVKYQYLSKDSLDLLAQDSIKLQFRSFNHNVGLASYFREQVKRELETILDSLKKPDGEPYDLYKDGLQVYTTLDATMQELAEASMREHLMVLQRNFESAFGDRAPWVTNTKLIHAALRNLPVYKSYLNAKLNNKQIQDSLNKKRKIELFRWEGDTIKELTVTDSLQHFLKFLNTGMLSIEPATGAIRTYVGGIDYRYFKFDHISQSQRQMGSTFKPIVFTAAIENGMNPCTYFSVRPITYTNYDNWTPTNSGEETEDQYLNYSLERALSNSVNTIAVKVLNKVGISKVIELTQKLGISKKLPHEPSLALGVAEVTLKEVTGAYASYVNDGKFVKPYSITQIRDRAGKVIASIKPKVALTPAYSNYTRQVLLEIMKSTVNHGTASRIRHVYNLKNDIAGKTGTTQNNKDGWFVGITPKLVTVTWVGNDNHNIGFSSTKLGQGANSALPIFAKFYQKLNADSKFDIITKSKFEVSSSQVIKDLDCKPEKRDSFLERLFRSKRQKKTFKGNK
ncbi:penicillin-binding protein 1A [Aestuariivivens sediminis]|uniref:penicillin-binding protein 1A n=1 Tax=Aestuariivivens sediminis TaxID=2913557 RepID=UPI001F568CDA|nr:transglycosylase domain-containing protein [Aestuariivivens sediminis]